MQLWGDFACARGAFARTKRSLIMLRPSLGPVADLLAKLVTSAASKGVKPTVLYTLLLLLNPSAVVLVERHCSAGRPGAR